MVVCDVTDTLAEVYLLEVCCGKTELLVVRISQTLVL